MPKDLHLHLHDLADHEMTSTPENHLRSINRFITTHDPATKKAIFSDAVPEKTQVSTIPGADFRLGYVTKGSPVNLNQDADLAVYKPYLESPPGLVASGGTVLRFVDVAPDSLSPMHRTVSLDYGVVLEGEMELVLDSGETRQMKRGDVAIQRGTMHAWRNLSPTAWGRMMYVLQECEPVEVGGEVLKEDYGTMKGVPASS
jgi:quercetin dioxygenase-like cupin family protein